MDRNPVLQDLHTFHNPSSSTGTNYQGKMTDNMFPISNNNSTISNASDTQSATSFLDALDFTNFDSSRFYQPPVPEPLPQQQHQQPQHQQPQHQQPQHQQPQHQQPQHQHQHQHQQQRQQQLQQQQAQQAQQQQQQIQQHQQQHQHQQQQQQQHQQHQQQQQNSQSVYPANVYYQPQQLHHLQQQQYLPVYATSSQQHNQILLQRYNSNGSTTSSTNSQPSYISNYSPMAHYNQSMQQQEQAVNKMYYNEYQQVQVPQNMTKKRKPDLSDDTLQKKKPKAKKKKVPKIIDPNAPPKPKRKTGLNKPLILSDALSELMDGDKELSRPELVQKLWKYIKGNDLQDPADRRFILCDAKLKKIFDQDRINSFGMNKDLSAHLTKKEDPVTIETNQIATKDIVQQEPTPSEDNNTTDFLL